MDPTRVASPACHAMLEARVTRGPQRVTRAPAANDGEIGSARLVYSYGNFRSQKNDIMAPSPAFPVLDKFKISYSFQGEKARGNQTNSK